MHSEKLKLVLEQILFSAHIFVLVILLAESRLLIPAWLQMAGRLHPLLLHFPIVVLLLAVVIILFPGLLKNRADQFYYGHFLLLLGSLFTAVTVIAGLFLSLEGGETTATLQNHKWTGLAVFWISSLLYWYYKRLGKLTRVKKILASLIGVLIIVTGHFGASITHGENFITAPFFRTETQLVSLEEADVFDHVIMPILENKCTSCHKASKQKGELRLDGAEYIIKGGESGPAVVAGDLEESLMAHRIMLPEEDEEHMPPEGKPQLSEEEKELITAWISSGGDFEKKVLAYDSEEPIFQLASQKFENVPRAYTFEAASPEKIRSLNSFYRKVLSLGADSPALSVSYFSRQNFEISSLEELFDVAEQVVTLNLNNMPVEDGDLELLSSFPNLEKLYLNFADIRGEGIGHLASLENLRILSLTGNVLDETAVGSLKELKGLNKLYLWNTGLGEDQISSLRESLPQALIETGYTDDGTVYQLNPPTVKFDEAFFRNQAEVEILHSIKSTSIHYTLDGSYPDSSNFILYKEPIVIDSNTVLRARAFADGWTGSAEAGAEFIKAGVRPVSYVLKHPPEDRYKGDLVNSLFDGEKGITDVWSLSWLGFIHTPLEVEMEFAGPQDISSLELSIWSNTGARFFPPKEVEIWTAKEGGSWEMVHQSTPEQPVKGEPNALKRVPITFKADGVEKMRLVARPVGSLPGWHGAAGEKARIMIDEVVIN
ncbi:MAG: c-type cytochrome domain-containing protein [Anditalea sp.]